MFDIGFAELLLLSLIGLLVLGPERLPRVARTLGGMATTDTIYVQSENKKRAASGKLRRVD